ncbi:hypothetical protein GC194_15725 [bacterium]|nr:hypothetical protein [bacterium]
MKIILNYNILLAILLLFAGSTAKGNMYVEKSKKVRKAYPAKEQTELEINSKYGVINVQPWSKDSMVFKITIVGRSKTEEFSQEMIDDTELNFSTLGDKIILNTSLNDEGAAIVTTFNKVASNISGSKSELNVNINVFMPAASAIKIAHKFGDIIIGSRSGKIDITTSYSDVKLGEVTGYTNLNLKFGDLNVQNVKRLNLDCEYANVMIFKADNADINSKGSKINFTEVQRLRARTKRDDYTIYKALSVNADGTYSNFVITELRESLNLNGKYDDLTIHSVQQGFTQITMNCERSNANMGFMNTCQFSIDINLELGDFNYTGMAIKVTESEKAEEDSVQYYGYVGSNAKPTAAVEIFGKETDVNFMVR